MRILLPLLASLAALAVAGRLLWIAFVRLMEKM